jgi:tripartite-type tricarboxylate transporter receptor subunit TctC
MLRLETGAALNDVPYRQLPQLVADFLGGRLQLYFGSGEPVVSMIRDGRAKAYGSTGATREAALPNVPTMTEAGFPGLTISPSDWTGLLAPAGTPASVVAKLNTAAVEALKAPEIQASVSKLGWTTKGSPQQEFATFVASDAMKWPAIVKAAGLKAE